MNATNRFSLVLGLVVSLATMFGCQQEDNLLIATGAVTFEGAAVTKGNVVFEDTSTGYSDTAELDAQGNYSIELPIGEYNVAVEPPLAEVKGDDTDDDFDYIKVDNIPEKYRNTYESILKVSVSAEQLTHNLEMTK
ncbi:MAG: hypothetical protein COA78_28825 [Blastopirellula sp.]|nr:MAG: hypothetical protein COA78_28825 [Blastopirellula sp.]